jgi:tRNA (guanine-N7-)-methyltransferase
LNTDSRLPAGSLIFPLETILQPLDAGALFAEARPLHIELGSGDGSFLAEYAALRPEWNFIGVERLLGRLRKIDRKGRRLGLVNLRVVRVEAAYFLEYLLPKRSAAALHIYFPDPWPKRKHRKNRLINDSFPALAATALEPGGIVYLRTDDADYFAQMQNVFSASPLFLNVPTPEPLAGVLTDFERGFLRRGVPTQRSAWQLKNQAGIMPFLRA